MGTGPVQANWRVTTTSKSRNDTSGSGGEKDRVIVARSPEEGRLLAGWSRRAKRVKQQSREGLAWMWHAAVGE